jgi:exopolyphosphatase/guanosine-5'-triphosphate,3'-diphosphate pyrophosphatase
MLPRASRRTVRWLAAMVRLAEGLDRSRAQLVHDIQLAQHDGGWTLQLVARGDVELECWAAQRHMAPLEKALKSTVTLLPARRHRGATRARAPYNGAAPLTDD